jgi:hypothetical protein
MRTAFVIVALIVPVIALALPDDATLSRLLAGTWHGHRHDTQYRADGTWIMDPMLYRLGYVGTNGLFRWHYCDKIKRCSAVSLAMLTLC